MSLRTGQRIREVDRLRRAHVAAVAWIILIPALASCGGESGPAAPPPKAATSNPPTSDEPAEAAASMGHNRCDALDIGEAFAAEHFRLSHSSLYETIGLTCLFDGDDGYTLSIYEYAIDANHPRPPLSQLKAPWREHLVGVGDGALLTSAMPGRGQGETVIDFDVGRALWRMVARSPSMDPATVDELTTRVAKKVAEASALSGPLVLADSFP